MKRCSQCDRETDETIAGRCAECDELHTWYLIHAAPVSIVPFVREPSDGSESETVKT